MSIHHPKRLRMEQNLLANVFSSSSQKRLTSLELALAYAGYVLIYVTPPQKPGKSLGGIAYVSKRTSTPANVGQKGPGSYRLEDREAPHRETRRRILTLAEPRASATDAARLGRAVDLA